MSALAGLEQALWDLTGKTLGIPAWGMLGGQVRERIRAYAWLGGDRPDEIEEAARGATPTAHQHPDSSRRTALFALDTKPFLFESGTVHIIQPDLSLAGGLLECRKIAAMAEAYDIALAPHCPLCPLALASCLRLAACTPNVAIQEVSLGIHYNVGHDLLHFVADPEVFSPVDEYLAISQKPGLGATIDETAVREAHTDWHRWRNPIWRHTDGNFAEW